MVTLLIIHMKDMCSGILELTFNFSNFPIIAPISKIEIHMVISFHEPWVFIYHLKEHFILKASYRPCAH